jgi:hypothetical protein
VEAAFETCFQKNLSVSTLTRTSVGKGHFSTYKVHNVEPILNSARGFRSTAGTSVSLSDESEGSEAAVKDGESKAVSENESESEAVFDSSDVAAKDSESEAVSETSELAAMDSVDSESEAVAEKTPKHGPRRSKKIPREIIGSYDEVST